MDNVKCRALGEVFECKGLKLRVVRGISCSTCAFYTSKMTCGASDIGANGILGPCAGVTREDGRDIVFKLEED